MLFRQLFDCTSCTYTYLLARDYGCEAIIIDPVFHRLALYEKLLRDFNLNLVMSLDTHVHADHITGSYKLRQLTGCDIALGEQVHNDYATKIIREGETIEIDTLSFKPLYTPGHTDDSYCFVMDDRVFTGDILMIRATGRTDFQNGNARQAYDSLFTKLLTLPDDLWVYPAHDYNGMTVSTIGEEKRFNPRLQVTSVEEYAAIMDHLELKRPKMIDVAVPFNLRSGEGYTEE